MPIGLGSWGSRPVDARKRCISYGGLAAHCDSRQGENGDRDDCVQGAIDEFWYFHQEFRQPV